MREKILKYISQKKWMARYPKLVTYEVLESHNKLYDKLVMQEVIENEELDDKPFYDLKKQEVIIHGKK